MNASSIDFKDYFVAKIAVGTAQDMPGVYYS